MRNLSKEDYIPFGRVKQLVKKFEEIKRTSEILRNGVKLDYVINIQQRIDFFENLIKSNKFSL